MRFGRELTPDTLVAGAARGMTRRRVLRNAGGFALGAAATVAYAGTRPDIAAACTYWSGCGPAPRCADYRCTGYKCNGGRSDTAWALWQGGSAPCSGDSGVDNCWTICQSGTKYFCCDCCAYRPSCTAGDSCYNCGSSGWRKCICKGSSGSC
jgi:hypothetical protein